MYALSMFYSNLTDSHGAFLEPVKDLAMRNPSAMQKGYSNAP